ncbi:glycosyltransferase [Collinsella tanakaei]|nr:glycosyltransferase [Collinsella tanakaei]
MRFTFVFDGLGCGGVERVGVDYCNALSRRGHAISVVNLVPGKDEFACQLDSGIAYMERNYPKRLAPERYCTLIKRKTWGRYAYPLAYLAATIATTLKKPALKRGIPEADVAVAMSGHYNDLTFVAKGIAPAKASIAWLHGGIASYLLVSDGYVNLYKRIRNLVCLVDEGNEEFAYANPFLSFNMRKIYNFVSAGEKPCSEEKVERYRRDYGDFALMVSRFDYPHKDHFTVIRALPILKDRYGLEPKVVFVGDGKSMDAVKELANQLGVTGQVVFAGFDPEPASYYKACGLVVQASAGTEGLPTTILEGMAFGKPVIATDVRTGPREIMKDGECGLLCRFKDPESLADKIALLLNDKDAYRRYADAGRKRVEDFSEKRSVGSLLDFAESILEGECEE